MTLFVLTILAWLLVCVLQWTPNNCHLFCFGGGSSSSSSNPVSNEQAAAQSGVAVGAGATNTTVDLAISDASPDAIALASHAIDANAVSQAAALMSVNDTIAQTGAVLNAAIDSNSGVAKAAIDANNQTTQETLNAVTNLAASGEAAFANLTAQSIQSALQIAGNAAPQTPGATQEILAGTQPIGTDITATGATTPTTTTNTKSLEEIMIIALAAIAGWILYKHNKV